MFQHKRFESHAAKEFIANDIVNIDPNETKYHGVDFSSQELFVGDCEHISVSGYAKGANSSCSKDVEFNFVASADGVNWDTVSLITLRVSLNGTNRVQGSANINVGGFKKLRLESIKNTETTPGYAINDVNCIYGKKF